MYNSAAISFPASGHRSRFGVSRRHGFTSGDLPALQSWLLHCWLYLLSFFLCF